MTEIKDQLSGLQLLKQARKQDGKFVLQELDDALSEIIKAIREAPHQGGSVDLQIKIEPQTGDGSMVNITAKVQKIKKPVIPPRPAMAYATKEGKMTTNDPQQGEMFDEQQQGATKINEETGEVVPIAGKLETVKPVGEKE